MKHKLKSLSEEMHDNDVIKVINEENASKDTENSVSFLFSLKNRIGGLARALRVFEVGSYFLLVLIQFKKVF